MTQRKQPLIAVVEGYGVKDAVISAGGCTISVDTWTDAEAALPLIDGILFTGGGDVDPKRYGAKRHAKVYGVDKSRDDLEFHIAAEGIARGIPMMGICRGNQLLNVAHGGTLNQNITDDKEVAEHWGVEMWVKLSPRSRLARTVQSIIMQGTHYHHQAIERVGTNLRVIARAGDGTVEAVESTPDHPSYVLGVQFHPEMDFHYDPMAAAVFEHFVKECSRRKAAHREPASARLMEVYDAMRVLEDAKPKRKAPLDYRKGHGGVMLNDYDNYEAWWDWSLDNDKDPTDWEVRRSTENNWWEDDDELDRIVKQSTLDEEVCAFPPCATPRDCGQWGDCAAEAVAAKTTDRLLTGQISDEELAGFYEAMSEAEAEDAIQRFKRGGKR
jgi:putative glutamine amidotransferase